MGTALAPDAANIFMALQEDFDGEWGKPRLDAVLPAAAAMPLGRRLIDDYTFVLTGVSEADVTAFAEEISRRIAPATDTNPAAAPAVAVDAPRTTTAPPSAAAASPPRQSRINLPRSEYAPTPCGVWLR
eukprot:jgi/Ulvmu1/6796/UM306_0003.1